MFPKLLTQNAGATSMYISQYVIMFRCYVLDTEGTLTLLIFSIIEPTDALISQIYLDYKMNLYMFREVPLPIIKSSLTVNLALVYVIRFEDSFCKL